LKVNLKHYFNELLNNFKDVISGEEQINSKLEDVLIDAQYAVTIGLIVNEILNNAIKYGRVDKRNLEINCSLNSKNGFIHFMISDNGPGFELEKQKSNSFGLSLIDDLTEQLNATIDFDSSSNGTCYSFQFQN
jgi:two-component system, sensor histidine kinase PdtaS